MVTSSVEAHGGVRLARGGDEDIRNVMSQIVDRFYKVCPVRRPNHGLTVHGDERC